MANTTTNTQKAKSFDNVKTVKTNVVNVARTLQQTLASIRQRANALSDAIQDRKAEFRQLEVDAMAVEVAEQLEEAVAPVETETVAEVEVPESVDNATEEPTVDAEPEVVEKPKTKVVTTMENGREVKTYTDEKGNVKVRKFLDLTASSKKPATSASGGRDSANKAQQGARTTKPDQGQAKRSGAQQSRPGAGKTFAPVMDIPRNEPTRRSISRTASYICCALST